MSNAIAVAVKPSPLTHPSGLFKWTLWLPVLAIAIGFRWVKARLTTPPTPAEARELEKAKQRRIRRQLRGLDAND